MNLLSNFLNGVNRNLRMKDIGRAINRSYSAEGLRDVSNAIVHIQIRNFSIYPTRFNKLPEFLDKSSQGIQFLHELWKLTLIIVLIIADDIGKIIHDLLILLDQPLQKSTKWKVQLLLKLLIQLFFDIPEAFIKFFGGIDILFQFHPSMVDLYQLMNAHKKCLLLNQRQFFGLEYFALGEGDMPELLLVNVKDVVDQVEVHVFVHVCLFQAFAGYARCEEEIGLDVDTVTSVFVVLDAPVVKLLVGLLESRRSDELVHLLPGTSSVEQMELLECYSLQRRSVCFFSVNDKSLFGLGLRLVCSDQALLETCPEDHEVRLNLVFGQSIGKLVVEIVVLHLWGILIFQLLQLVP